MENVLVTGGAGFIGSHLAEALVKQGCKVTVVDNLCEGRKKNLEAIAGKIKFVEADIRDRKKMLECTEDVNTIFHLAALKSVPASVENPKAYQDVNVNGTKVLLKAAAEKRVKKFVFSSSSSVYGDLPELPKKESMVPKPCSPYAETKLAGEQLLKEFSEKGINTISLRYFNVYGPKQNPNSKYAAVIPYFINAALLGKNIVIYGDGEQTRDFTYVGDVVNANILAMDSASSFNGAVVNIAGGKSISVNSLFETIQGSVNSSSKAVYEPERQGDVMHSLADISFAEKLLSWKPQTSLSRGLVKTIDFFKGD